jgi:hypothetical protein
MLLCIEFLYKDSIKPDTEVLMETFNDNINMYILRTEHTTNPHTFETNVGINITFKKDDNVLSTYKKVLRVEDIQDYIGGK